MNKILGHQSTTTHRCFPPTTGFPHVRPGWCLPCPGVRHSSVLRHGTLAFVDLDVHRGLVILSASTARPIRDPDLNGAGLGVGWAFGVLADHRVEGAGQLEYCCMTFRAWNEGGSPDLQFSVRCEVDEVSFHPQRVGLKRLGRV